MSSNQNGSTCTRTYYRLGMKPNGSHTKRDDQGFNLELNLVCRTNTLACVANLSFYSNRIRARVPIWSFWVQIHLGLNLIKDWTLWANPWLTNGLIKDLILFFKKGRLRLSLLISRTHAKEEKLHATSGFFFDAVPTKKNNKIYGRTYLKWIRERDWFIRNPDKDYLLKIGDFSWKERNNG